MVKILFLDEQHAEVAGDNFTAVGGMLIDPAELLELRSGIFEVLCRELSLSKNQIENVPILHGSDLLRDFCDDDKRIIIVSKIFELIAKTSANFIRVGYFHRSLMNIPNGDVKKVALGFSLMSIWMVMSREDSPFLIVTELDREELKRDFSSLSKDLGLYHQIGKENISVPYSRTVGHFFALKQEVGCQLADLILYCGLKKITAKNEFSELMGAQLELIADRFLENEIIWLNDSSRNLG